jgi:hypothetical protein
MRSAVITYLNHKNKYGLIMYMVKLRNTFESIIETIEIMNDKELMAGIKRSNADFEAGRIHKLMNDSRIKW